MRVLAIDPGFGRCGVAVVEKENGKERLILSECIETSAKDTFPERLAEVCNACERVIIEAKPQYVAIEKLYFATNQKTAMQVAEVRGALIALAARYKLPVSEYTPMQVKSALGYGKADKKQMAKMIHLLVKIEKPIRYDDEYDAIAIGVTHLAHSR
ncbi:crossover junction endodeoxyribonuclease RuvC [Candidatus Kaiserbacteria bacterium]|nr:crossover junction endodeoxyribonuclease RuvC [Candidatus Kaiserbacteria bacterium]